MKLIIYDKAVINVFRDINIFHFFPHPIPPFWSKLKIGLNQKVMAFWQIQICELFIPS